MRIALFADHPYWGQLNNNGGTRTILLSANTLRHMGHDAYLVAHKDKFSWFAHPTPSKRIRQKTDVVVAVGISDVPLVMARTPQTSKMAYWARPFETWQMSKEKIVSLLQAFERHGGIVMVNSGWQHDYLRKHGLHPYLVFAGIDPEPWPCLQAGVHQKPIGILCQYSDKKRKNWEEFRAVARALGKECRYMAFGSGKCKEKWLDAYVRNATQQELVGLYNASDVMFCPNTHEGFYNPASQAALCGCLIVRSNRQRGGMDDWCGHDECEIYADAVQAVEILRNPDFRKSVKAKERLIEVVGDRRRNMRKMVEVLS